MTNGSVAPMNRALESLVLCQPASVWHVQMGVQ